ncbi:hypothetical protein [Arenibacter algicola]|jgi:hypothetical protein|uniref:Uncharacterized protein n=1 Tax=Arenibacter algicola TaxID=616991 RepID=A0A221UXD2_9FLAO|nr:hypothetical protein [Arenibacter algicola]ASO06039.1 hypothetical protein AREALGSMS7_02596 [Arenibacter algicola]|tara:strand:+ start:475 stop:696 length:222 start_codon:yes stop_codon:yes gene_type:complete
MENKIVIDLEDFKGKTSRDLKAHIEQILSNIKCSVEVPGPNQKIRRIDFRISKSIDLRTEYADYKLVDIVNEN